jgi:hypothetical protein
MRPIQHLLVNLISNADAKLVLVPLQTMRSEPMECGGELSLLLTNNCRVAPPIHGQSSSYPSSNILIIPDNARGTTWEGRYLEPT